MAKDKAAGFYATLKEAFTDLVRRENIQLEKATVHSRALTPEEAIGITERKDYPILTGKDVMIQAEVGKGVGQAFTDAPALFSGSVAEVLNLDLDSDSHNRAIFIAVLNAVMNSLELCDDTIHCKNGGPGRCSHKILTYIKEHFPADTRIGIIGYQPSILEALSGTFDIRIVDLNPANIGEIRENTLIEDGGKPEITKEICETSDLILCTGSTICNGSIVDFLPYSEKTLFYGTTLSGAARLLNLHRLCFASEMLKEDAE